ncbi:MAG: CRISPR-associated protein Cas4 [Dehalococcoidia bacterium]|nr:CRISPR-associated protein Cas4 [Dehalococcoidia bacterium]
MDRGLEEHFDLGEQIDTVTEEEKKSRVFLFVGLGLIVISVLIFVGWLVVSFPVVAGIVVWVILLVCGAIFTARSRRRYKYVRTMRKEYGIPEGRIVYTDLDKPAEPLFSEQLRLTGKPDFIVNFKGQYVPVEVKTGVTDSPYRNHVLQLAAYCLLVEEKYNQVIPFGVLVYGGGRQFRIPFEAYLRRQVITILEEMRTNLAAGTIQRNHNLIAKCQYCSMRVHCNQRIFQASTAPPI